MKKKLLLVLIVVFGILAISCADNKKEPVKGSFIYYRVIENDALVKEEYELPDKGVKESVEQILKDMKESPKQDDYQSVIPENVMAQDVRVDEESVTIDFNNAYNKMGVITETLLKAAVVQTLTQLDTVNEVYFTVQGTAITKNDGTPVGPMRSTDFVQNVGNSIHSTQKANLTLYFGNESGKALEKSEVSVRYNSNSTIEKLVMDRLIKGPGSKGETATIPSETSVLNVAVKDDICYINLSEGFAAGSLKVNPEVAVYSIVNSIIENSEADKVQLSIGGETNVMFQGVFDLSKPLTKDTSIVEP